MSINKKVDENKEIDDINNVDEITPGELIYDDEGPSVNEEINKIKKLKKELKECQKEKQNFLDGWQRSKADYVNFKKRSEEDKTKIREYGIENIICDLLPTVDNFEIAFKNEEEWNKAPESWRSGVQFIYTQLIKTLESNGVRQIDPLGDDFNPEVHHSIEMVDVSDIKKDGKIVDVQQKGYFLNGKNIRPATVRVGSFIKE